jgi:hypothetical protein
VVPYIRGIVAENFIMAVNVQVFNLIRLLLKIHCFLYFPFCFVFFHKPVKKTQTVTLCKLIKHKVHFCFKYFLYVCPSNRDVQLKVVQHAAVPINIYTARKEINEIPTKCRIKCLNAAEYFHSFRSKYEITRSVPKVMRMIFF